MTLTYDNIQLLFVWAPIINIQVILDGIFLGAVFALSAYGLALVWGVMNVKNLAQGDFVIMGGYLALALSYRNIPLPLTFLIVVSVMFCFGWIVYVLVIRRVINQDMFVSLLATFGLSLLLQQVMNLFFGPEVQTIDMKLPVIDTFEGMVTIPYSKILSLALAAIITVCVVIFMKRSRMGQAIRATAQDPRAARVLGIDTDKVYAFTFAFNALRPGGWLVFSTEKSYEPEYHLQDNARFAHNFNYVCTSAEKTGFLVTAYESAQLRTQQRDYVEGLCYILQRPI